eukprot:5204110-Pleurochrysis_carterae.AAC.1
MHTQAFSSKSSLLHPIVVSLLMRTGLRAQRAASCSASCAAPRPMAGRDATCNGRYRPIKSASFSTLVTKVATLDALWSAKSSRMSTFVTK